MIGLLLAVGLVWLLWLESQTLFCFAGLFKALRWVR